MLQLPLGACGSHVTSVGHWHSGHRQLLGLVDQTDGAGRLPIANGIRQHAPANPKIFAAKATCFQAENSGLLETDTSCATFGKCGNSKLNHFDERNLALSCTFQFQSFQCKQLWINYIIYYYYIGILYSVSTSSSKGSLPSANARHPGKLHGLAAQ